MGCTRMGRRVKQRAMLDQLWPRSRTHSFCKWQRHPASLVHLIFLDACMQKSDQTLSCDVIVHSFVHYMAPSKCAPIHSSVHSLSHLFIVHTHNYIRITHTPVHPFMHALTHPDTHAFIHSPHAVMCQQTCQLQACRVHTPAPPRGLLLAQQACPP